MYLPFETPSYSSRSDSETHYAKDKTLAPDSERDRNMTHTTREVDLHGKDTNILRTGDLGVDGGGSDRNGHFVGCWIQKNILGYIENEGGSR